MLITNIGAIVGLYDCKTYLRGHEIDNTDTLTDAWILIDDTTGHIADYGPMSAIPAVGATHQVVDADGALVMPTFCDSHTHIVYPESRSGEFLDKINGLSYEQIAARGGGILNSADRLANMTDDQLFEASLDRLNEVIAMGTGAIEIKSGYGLSLDTELKMLRVIARLAESAPIAVRATFLGAHAVGRQFAGRQEQYVDHIIRDMLPAVARQGIAQYVDVFCDTGFFTPQQTDRILRAATKFGMRPKIHGNELDVSGGVEVAVRNNALSVDHLERTTTTQLELLGNSRTAATMLPGASFFLGMPYGDARRAINHNAILALASDFNPGSSPSGDMRFVWALACIKMRLTPVQALNALTRNGAYAMGLDDTHGAIRRNTPANLIVTRPLTSTTDPTAILTEIPYRYTRPWIRHIILNGRIHL